MKQLLKTTIKPVIHQFAYWKNSISKSKTYQLMLMNQYKQLATTQQLPNFQETGCHIYSQTDEDGFLLYIFSLIGFTNKQVVEICAGDGFECNAANLIINHGWKGLLFDGNPTNIQIGKKIYNSIKSRIKNIPKLVNAWITAENVNKLITKSGFKGEIDLLSLDLDGIDYWIWKSINCIQPRVVILEYNNNRSVEESVTIPYDPNFKAQIINGEYYCGASLRAFVKLGKKLGYRLVGSNTMEYNAFFLRDDIANDKLPEVSVESCLGNNTDSLDQNVVRMISQLEWEKV
jgi:hypothetical protein